MTLKRINRNLASSIVSAGYELGKIDESEFSRTGRTSFETGGVRYEVKVRGRSAWLRTQDVGGLV